MVIWQWGFFSAPHLLWYRFMIMVISANPWHSHQASVYQRSCHYLFFGLVLSRLGFEHSTFRLRGERSHPLRHRHSGCRWKVASRDPSRNIPWFFFKKVWKVISKKSRTDNFKFSHTTSNNFDHLQINWKSVDKYKMIRDQEEIAFRVHISHTV